MHEELRDSLLEVFNERKNFIIIGLTGRTGSGCTMVADIFKNNFEELLYPPSCLHENADIEDRKDYIVYKYAKVNWKPFKIIKVRNVITSFLLENDFNRFKNYINDIELSFDKRVCIKSLCGIKHEYDLLHNRRLEIKAGLQEDYTDSYLYENRYELEKFYLNDIPLFTEKLNDLLNTHNKELFTYIYQSFGNNIRTSGDVYDATLVPNNIFKFPQRINAIIKILRKIDLERKDGVRIILDSIRNPFEATFFRDRYSNFYLFSVNVENEVRINRLYRKGFTLEQINNIDKREYPEKKKGKDFFSSLDMQKCIELSDVFIHNPDCLSNNQIILKKQLLKYTSLIMHPGLISPSMIEHCMQIAYNSKLNSGCVSRQVGAAVTNSDYSVKGIGWNDVPEGQVPCNLRDANFLINDSDNNAFSDYEKYNNEYKSFFKMKISSITNSKDVLKDQTWRFCFKDSYNQLKNEDNQVYTRSLHAEENAFLQIVKYGGTSVKNGYLFTTASPCELCAKKAYQLGIKEIYYIDPYPGISQEHILNTGSNRIQMKIFIGAIGRAYAQFYSQILPIKDEIALLSNYSFKDDKQTEKQETTEK